MPARRFLQPSWRSWWDRSVDRHPGGRRRAWLAGYADGADAALGVLLVIVAVLGSALTRIPLASTQLVVGTLPLLFGMRWLRKAVLRAAGIIPLHDHSAAYAKQTHAMQTHGAVRSWDGISWRGHRRRLAWHGLVDPRPCYRFPRAWPVGRSAVPPDTPAYCLNQYQGLKTKQRFRIV